MVDTPELSVGSKAPEFILPASNGTEISLSSYYTGHDVILFFVREFN